MRFFTQQECESWLSDRHRSRPDLVPDLHVERMEYPPKPYQVFPIAHRVASLLSHRKPVLLFITEFGIWPSSENWHLYYKLRQAYGDTRLLQDAPGHLFLEHEVEDLGSFMQLSMLNGWGGYVLAHANYVNAFFSHDEYIDFFATRSDYLAHVRKLLGASQPAVDDGAITA